MDGSLECRNAGNRKCVAPQSFADSHAVLWIHIRFLQKPRSFVNTQLVSIYGMYSSTTHFYKRSHHNEIATKTSMRVSRMKSKIISALLLALSTSVCFAKKVWVKATIHCRYVCPNHQMFTSLRSRCQLKKASTSPRRTSAI